ncbi:hypothetical protein EYF80_016690 [Liparis tanakae]|uniref:Uncharacterized protein n=1 Tax=Liparis tanakae TaxID=230148 RepID=A0A4Z2I5B5_9TELE|nr:hypothetical protein EYF80_016690 [Liparis tanakae]
MNRTAGVTTACGFPVGGNADFLLLGVQSAAHGVEEEVGGKQGRAGRARGGFFFCWVLVRMNRSARGLRVNGREITALQSVDRGNLRDLRMFFIVSMVSGGDAVLLFSLLPGPGPGELDWLTGPLDLAESEAGPGSLPLLPASSGLDMASFPMALPPSLCLLPQRPTTVPCMGLDSKADTALAHWLLAPGPSFTLPLPATH